MKMRKIEHWKYSWKKQDERVCMKEYTGTEESNGR